MSKERENFKRMLKKFIDDLTIETMVNIFNYKDPDIPIDKEVMWEYVLSGAKANQGFQETRRTVMEIMKEEPPQSLAGIK